MKKTKKESKTLKSTSKQTTQKQEKSKNKMMSMIEGGTTVLYVSHSIDSIKELCSKVIWLDHGKIVKMGDTKEICDEYYKKLMK